MALAHKVSGLEKTLASLPGSITDLQAADAVLDFVPPVMQLLRDEIRFAARGSFTVPQIRLMANVYGGLSSPTELAEILGVSLPAISKMVDLLVARGFLTREEHPGNRKQIVLKLSPKGRSRFLRTRSVARDRVMSGMALITDAQKMDLVKGLAVLAEMMRVRPLRLEGGEALSAEDVDSDLVATSEE